MIEALSEKIALSLKSANEDETPSVAVMKFALIGIINNVLTLLCTMTAGYVLDAFWETALAYFAFGFLRFFAGGIHLNSPIICTVVSTTVLAGIPHIPINDTWSMYLTGVSAILVLLFAPSNIKGHTRIPEKYFPYLKLVSLLIVGSNFIIVSHILAIAFIIQTISLIRFKEV